jgi:type I restriction enzyme S subunit
MKAVEGWNQISIGEFVDLINGFAFPSEGFTEGEGKPLIRIRDLERQKTEVNFRGKYNDRYLVKREDLLIGMDGDFQTVKWKGSDALLNQRVCKLITKSPKVLVQDFLFYRIIEEILHIHRITAATTVKHLSSKDVLGIKIDLPSKPEQTKIAEILSTVDRAVEQTEALIVKQHRIKIGLMQDLLTHGIDEYGNLRSEQTHEFKDSPVGRIPVEWEVKRLSELVDEGITYGIVQAGPNIENGVPYIRTGDMAGETINAAQLLKTSERIAKSYKRSAVFTGDIVFALRATVGKVLPVSKELEGSNLTQGTAKISPKKSIESTFLLWALQTAVVQDQIRLHQKGTTFMEITLADLRSIEVALPIVQDEQSSISEKLTKHDDLRLQYIQNRQKLRSLKTALMQDLLTGKKRVTPLLKQEARV